MGVCVFACDFCSCRWRKTVTATCGCSLLTPRGGTKQCFDRQRRLRTFTSAVPHTRTKCTSFGQLQPRRQVGLGLALGLALGLEHQQQQHQQQQHQQQPQQQVGLVAGRSRVWLLPCGAERLGRQRRQRNPSHRRAELPPRRFRRPSTRRWRPHPRRSRQCLQPLQRRLVTQHTCFTELYKYTSQKSTPSTFIAPPFAFATQTTWGTWPRWRAASPRGRSRLQCP